MNAFTQHRAAISCRSIALGCLSLSIATSGSLRAQAPAAQDEPQAKTSITPLPAKLAALLPKSRQLLHDGDLRGAEEVARYDLKHHTNVAQLAGSLEALTSIYRQSGRYAEALAAGTRYEQVLEKIPDADPSKRQDMALQLAEILASMGKYPEAVAHVDDALKIPDGWRATDPLWEPHAYVVRAQVERVAGQSAAASNDWREVETRSRAILDRIRRSGPNVELEEAALKLLTESLVATDRTQEAIVDRGQFLTRHDDDQTRARNWSEIAKCHALLQQTSQEEHALREALRLETQDRAREKEPHAQAEQADLHDRLAIVMAHRGDARGAELQWKDSAAIYQQLIASRTGRRDAAERLGYLTKLQAVFERAGQWQQAVRIGQQLVKQHSQTLLADDPTLWRMKSTLGTLYARAGDKENAKMALTEALAYWRAREPQATGDLMQTLVQLSQLALAGGDRRQAGTYAEEAVKICQQAPAGHELQLAEAYNNLAAIQVAEGQNENALEQFGKAVEICRARPRDQRASAVHCETLLDIAKVYKSEKHFRQAAEYCTQALEVRQQLAGNDAASLIGLYLAIASLQLAEEPDKSAEEEESALVDEAAKNIQAARNLCEKQGWLEMPAGIGVLELEAVVDVRREKIDEARKSLDSALSLARKSQHRTLEAKILRELTALDRRAGSPE